MPETASQLERYMLTLINQERTSRGLDPLQLERNLNASAEDHSEWMLQTDTFSHTGAGGSSATDRIRAELNLQGSWRTAENIAIQSERGATGYRDDVADLHQSLMNSPGHRANLLNPDLDYVGIGVEVGNFRYDSGRSYQSVIVTQNFASTQGPVDLDTGATPPPPPPPPPVGRPTNCPVLADLMQEDVFQFTLQGIYTRLFGNNYSAAAEQLERNAELDLTLSNSDAADFDLASELAVVDPVQDDLMFLQLTDHDGFV